MDKNTIQLLVEKAEQARGHSYSPYSNFSVGAALLCADGSIYLGTNIENASFTPTVCAERVAFFSAIFDGKHDFVAIAIVGGKKDEGGNYCPPCGVCRQVMSEFCTGDFKIILGGGTEPMVLALDEVMPLRFDLEKGTK